MKFILIAVILSLFAIFGMGEMEKQAHADCTMSASTCAYTLR